MPNMEVPDQDKRDFNDSVIVPLATEDFYQAVVIIQRSEKHLVEVFQCGTQTDDAIDLLLTGHFILHELRRQEGEADSEEE